MAAEASSGASTPAAAGRSGERRDGLWLLVSWIVLSIIGCLLVALVWGPHLPPGAASQQARSQQVDITVLGTIAAGRHRHPAVLRLGARLLAAEAG